MNINANIESIASQLIKESLQSTSYSSSNEKGFTPTEITFKIFPYLLDVYEEALAATKSKNKRYKRSNTVLGAHLQTEVLPELKSKNNAGQLDIVLSEVYSAYPEMKAIVSQAERDFPGGGNTGGPIFAIIGTLVAAVCVYAVGYAIGYALS